MEGPGMVLCVTCFSLCWKLAEPSVRMAVSVGGSVALHCDQIHNEVTTWFGQHCGQAPHIVISARDKPGNPEELMYKLTRYSTSSAIKAAKNPSNNSISLRIHNISESDLGLFYCSTGTENEFIGSEIILFQKEAHGQCWVLLVSVCPVCAVVTAVLSSACVYWICRRKGPACEIQQPAAQDGNRDTAQEEDGEVNYATVNIPKLSKRPVKQVQNESCTYAAVCHT
ncbi:hypothetical protein AGOR_G00079030 [Albula goreensis]|uniref:Immunoglobulin domain-containing protein n=1 Tax=Albula goreensis TaxID=1534307 RepID=A0A8T3DJA6_9TELE|nr:hypothetical protein AGOR_G00079030 [Albula goreensis]